MKQFTILSLCTLLVSGAAMAATPDHGEHQGHGDHATHRPAGDDFATLDLNRDGALTSKELAKHRLGPHFGMLDSNRDGRLSAAEFAAGRDM